MMKRWLAAALAAILALGGLALAEDALLLEVATSEWTLSEGEARPNAVAPEAEESAPEATEAQIEDNAPEASDPSAVKIDKDRFPDARFREVISKQLDTDGDGLLSGEEADMAVILDLSGKGISRLDGIECLTKLEYLYCQKNELKKLDLSGRPSLKYLDCAGNRLTSLKLARCRGLEYLDCGQNKLKKLDVSGCAALIELDCADNSLSSLNVKKNASLARLDCRKNRLKAIDVSENEALTALTCQGNPIGKLNVKKLPGALRVLAARENLRKWNDKEHYWIESETSRLVLPASTKVVNGKQTLYKKGYYVHIKVGKGKRKKFKHLNDAQYANFRSVATTGMGKKALYRSTHPLDSGTGRNKQAMKAMKKAGIRSVINMTDSIESVLKSRNYKNSYYASTAIWAKKMNIGKFLTKSFRKDIASICRFMAKNDGPYLVHCIAGRDRTGFLCAVLECLMGASAEEVVQDYEVTYYNFNGIKVGSAASEYIAYNRIRLQLAKAFDIASIFDPQVDLAVCAEAYLRSCGLSDGEIVALKARLAANY